MTPDRSHQDGAREPFTRREFLGLAGVGVAVLADPTGVLGGWTLPAGGFRAGPASLAGAAWSTVEGSESGRFAADLALAGEVALVGVPAAAVDDGPSVGRAELLVRSPGGWRRRATLRPESPGGQFGRAVAVADGVAAVGVPLGPEPAGPHGGRTAVFARRAGGWRREATLAAPDASGVDRFGATLAADGPRLLVGAPGTRSGRPGPGGAAHLFRRTRGGWNREASLAPRDDAIEGAGRAVALEGRTALVGARRRSSDRGASSEDGVVTVYRRSGGGWRRRSVLTPVRDGAGRFGASVATTGSTAVVGAPTESTDVGPGAGAVHVFRRRDGRWRREAVLRDERGIADGMFGAAVAAGRDAVLVGSGNGPELVLFTRSDDGWREAARWRAAARVPEEPGPRLAMDGARALAAVDDGGRAVPDRASPGIAVLEA